MRPILILTTLAALMMTACASAQQTEPPVPTDASKPGQGGAYEVSDAARRTAVLGPDGAPLGISAYDGPSEAIEAGDMAAFIAMVAETGDGETMPEGLGSVILAVDRIAAGDFAGARKQLEAGRGKDSTDPIIDYVSAWLLALEGDVDAAVDLHRSVDESLPGLTAELSLAAMLNTMGRTDEALAVYASLTPARIEAPDHQFDPKGILFSHVQLVVSRRALLLRRLGRIEEAKTVYKELAAAEPEQAAAYDAALESLETGKGLEDTPLTPKAAFARSVSDLGQSLFQQRVIRNAMIGRRLRGMDKQRATFEQLALMLDPGNEGLRETVTGLLYRNAHYQGAAHTALTAPEATAGLQVSAAQALMESGREARAREAIDAALDLAEADERLAVVSGAARLLGVLGDEARAVSLAGEARKLASNPAERASAAALSAQTLQQFGRPKRALAHARRAQELDNTHERRMALAQLLGEAGQVERGLQLIRRERLRRPNDPYMLNTLGYYLIEQTDKHEEGFRVLYKANALARNDPYIADSLGWAYYRLGHLDKARRLIELARKELQPKRHWELEDHLGDILWHQGERDAARAAWRAALEETPPSETAARLRDKLETGLGTPPPERRDLPAVSSQDPKVTERET